VSARRTRALRVIAAALAFVLAGAAGACSTGGASDEASPVFPGAEWPVAEPSAVGLDAAALGGVRADAEARDSDCIAVVKDGLLVEQATWNGTTVDDDHEAFSVSKSITSTLVGIAEGQGFLSVDEPAATYLTEWQGTPSESVTIRNLLANDSGREYEFTTDYVGMAAQAPDKTAFALGLGQSHPPGERWEYNNSAIQTLEAVLERATGQDVEAFARESLFQPIGMTSTIRRDDAGNPLTFMGTQASCLDLARFGYLFLRGGRWEDRQVVPEEWVVDATTPSQPLQPNYGYLWWLNEDGDPQWSDLPEDAYAAIGLGGQVVLVVPSWDLVATRMGRGFDGDGGGAAIIDVMAARLRQAREAGATGEPTETTPGRS
jgi:CubicO group peptidase (beta-lactamase class C family)